MFSHRFSKDTKANRLTLALERAREAGRPILDLTESNPTRCGFHYDEESISRAISSPGIMRYEPDPRGLSMARQAIAAYYGERGVVVDPEFLVLSSGTSEAYGYLFKLLADPGGEILVPVPGYPLLEVLTSLDSMRLVPYRSIYDAHRGWRIDLERLANTISNRTKAIVAVSPNNPTGAFLKEDELAGMIEICRRFDLALIVDEVFSDYGVGDDQQRVRTIAGTTEAMTFVLNGFSKIVGLPQLKLAWTYVSGPPKLRERAREGLEFIADAYLSVNTPIQLAAPSILGQRSAIQSQIRRRLDENERILHEALHQAGSCRILKREGGWYAVIRLPDDVSDEELCLLCLEEDLVLVHPGYFYDFPGGSHVVLSLLTQVGFFREGVSRLAGRLAFPHRLQAGAQGDIVRA
ncbi:MAG TPA: pyridoxal phosphate-dependent aminotransferase [Spirochaetia bacterium]|nr:pyridoxal phosphate-dependent aminotransferase [Spirochaetia bacterium]